MLMDRVIMERLGEAISGVARGPSGDWLFRFKMAIRDKGFRQVKLESDDALLIENIRRTNNKVADRLAKTISDNIDRLVVLEDLPSEINILLEEDICLTVLVES
ncbi:hypothetical protein Goarm_010258, partial [Gossypium armourianum]|nr:hypothetical protein [Gossypium armourianum]